MHRAYKSRVRIRRAGDGCGGEVSVADGTKKVSGDAVRCGERGGVYGCSFVGLAVRIRVGRQLALLGKLLSRCYIEHAAFALLTFFIVLRFSWRRRVGR